MSEDITKSQAPSVYWYISISPSSTGLYHKSPVSVTSTGGMSGPLNIEDFAPALICIELRMVSFKIPRYFSNVSVLVYVSFPILSYIVDSFVPAIMRVTFSLSGLYVSSTILTLTSTLKFLTQTPTVSASFIVSSPSNL